MTKDRARWDGWRPGRPARLVVGSCLVWLAIGTGYGQADVGRPPNDDFKDRIRLIGGELDILARNDGATKEACEKPLVSGAPMRSMWWVWSPPEEGFAVVSTTNSPMDTVVGVAVGKDLCFFDATVGVNDDAVSGIRTSWLGFDANPDEDYNIEVDTKGAQGGEFELQIRLYTVPVVVQEPTDLETPEQTDAWFQVVALGARPLRYQWQFRSIDGVDFADLAGKTSSDLSLTKVAKRLQEGFYRCRVSNARGEVVSQEARLRVLTPPVIVPPYPQGASLPTCGNWCTTVHVVGELPLAYEWQFRPDGATEWRPLPAPFVDPNRPDLCLPDLELAYLGDYRVVVTNSAGRAESDAVRLTVAATAPVIKTQPKHALGIVGEEATMSVEATGCRVDAFDWYFRPVGSPPNTQTPLEFVDRDDRYLTDAGILFAPVSTNHAGYYSVAVKTSDGRETRSSEALLTVEERPPNDHLFNGFLIPPTNHWVTTGFNKNGTVEANEPKHHGSAPLHSVWWWYTTNVQGVATLDLAGTKFKPRLAVYADEGFFAMEGLVLVRSGTTSVRFLVESNVTYQIAVDGQAAADQGDLQLRFTFLEAKEGDCPEWLAEPTGTRVVGDHRLPDGGCEDVRLSGEATSILPVGYYWLFNSTPIPGATERTLLLRQASVEDSGAYQLVATNAACAVTSRVAQVTVIPEPVIVRQPRWLPALASAYSLCSTARLEVVAASCRPMEYQWRRNGIVIPGATESFLNFSSLVPSLAGDYDVLVRNANGAIASEVATLAVDPEPPIAQNPKGDTYPLCGEVTLSVNASGCASPEFLWRRNGEPLAGATASSLRLTSLLPGDAGEYDVLLFLGSDVVTSKVARVLVDASPKIAQQPANQAVRDCDAARFCVGGAASPCVPVGYQWLARRSGESAFAEIPGATNACLELPAVSIGDVGTYRVVLDNGFATVTSRDATLAVDARPVITLQPADQRIRLAASFTNRIAATSCSSLDYHWFLDGTPVVPDLRHELTAEGWLIVRSAESADAGKYTCVVSNDLASVTSRAAIIRVVRPPPNDDFVNRIRLIGTNVTATTYDNGELYHNELATREAGEPRHAGLLASRSVWWTWTAPTPGRVTLEVSGSRITPAGNLDTLLGVYLGDRVEALSTVVSNDDSGIAGGSRVTFLAARGKTFHFAVDGKGDAEGTIRLHLEEEEIISPPIIDEHPASLAATNGETAEFHVRAHGSPDLLYQWTKDGVPIPGATNDTLLLRDVQPSDEANYRVTIRNEYEPSTNSRIARLTFGSIIRGQVTDATNDEPIPGATVSVGGISTLTDDNGNYELVGVEPGELRADFWAVRMRVGLQEIVEFRDQSTADAVSLRCEKRPEYIDFEDAQFQPVRGLSVTNKISMSPVLTGMRFVLNWGLEPADLDAVLLNFSAEGVFEQADYLWPRNGRGSTNLPPFITFDKDVVRSYGPETVTIHRLVPGTYRLYVKKFSPSARGSLSQSHAAVRVYEYDPVLEANRHLGTLNVPTEGEGIYWHVCDVDGATRTVTWRNVLTDEVPRLLTPFPEDDGPSIIVLPSGEVVSANPTRRSITGLQYDWRFGDGGGSTNREPAHAYLRAGCYEVGLTVALPKDERLATDALVRPCFIEVTNGPPVAAITWPPNRRILRAGDPIAIEVRAEDTDRIPSARAVRAVELFRVIGSSTHRVSSLTGAEGIQATTFTDTAAPGTYVFVARVTDDHGAVGWSTPVHLDLRDLSGEILILRNGVHPEIDLLEETLYRMDIPVVSGIGSGIQRRPPTVRILDQEGLHFDLVRGFRLIIWDDAGIPDEGITANDVLVLRQAWEAGIPLYFIGRHLSSDAFGLEDPEARDTWIDLIHLTPTEERVGPGTVWPLPPAIENELFHSGWYGEVGPFELRDTVEDTRVAGGAEAAEARAMLMHGVSAGGGDPAEEAATGRWPDVLVRMPPADQSDVFQARRLTQNFLVGNGREPGSFEQVVLFQNGVLWLLRNACDYYSATPSLFPAPGGSAGVPLDLEASLLSNGRLCPARGVLATFDVPPGVAILEFSYTSTPEDGVLGELRRMGQRVEFGFSRIDPATVVDLRVTVVPRYGGNLTNWFSVVADYRPLEQYPIIVEVAGPPPELPRLNLKWDPEGVVLCTDEAPACDTLVEVSSDLRVWSALIPERVLNGDQRCSPPIDLNGGKVWFFRLRCR